MRLAHYTVIFCATADIARTAFADITIEAEYGSFVWEGSRYTAAHHQPQGSVYAGDHVIAGGRPSPCMDGDIPRYDEATDLIVGISHFDLDTLGGLLRAVGPKDFFEEKNILFWRLAAAIDVQGPHRAELIAKQLGATEELRLVRAFWAWSKENRFDSRNVGSARDVTDFYHAAHGALYAILIGREPVLIERGEAMLREEAAMLEQRSFLARKGGVALRIARKGEFVSASYGEDVAIVAWSFETRAVAVSFADAKAIGLSACDIVKNLWGPEAGGHPGIGGGPRGVKMPFEEAERAFEMVVAAVAAVRAS